MIDMSALTFCECIYSDQTGRVKVMRAKLKVQRDGEITSKEVVVKATSFNSKNESAELLEELSLSNSRHKNICEVYGYSFHTFPRDSDTRVLIVMERLKCDLEKDAQQRMAAGKYYSERELLEMLWQFVDALRFMQRKGLCHRDIKPQNLFVAMDGTFKISDFGSCKIDISSRAHDSLQGSPLYLSPLLKLAYRDLLQYGTTHISDHIYKSDVFSLGVTFIFLCLLSPPMALMNVEQMDRETSKIVHDVAGRYTWKLLKYLVKMMRIEERDRPDFEELMREMEQDHDAFPAYVKSPASVSPYLQAQLLQFSQLSDSTALQALQSALSLPLSLTPCISLLCYTCGAASEGALLYCQSHWACPGHQGSACSLCCICPRCSTSLQIYSNNWYCPQCQNYPYSSG